MDVAHASIWVSDMDEAVAFFVDGLGLDRNWSFSGDEVENVYVGGEHGEIQLKYAPDHDVPEPDRRRADHIGIAVEDTDTALERARERVDIEVVKGPMDVPDANSRVVFFEGFDGYVFEFVQQLE